MKKESDEPKTTEELIDIALVDLAIVKRTENELSTRQSDIQDNLQTLYVKHVLEEGIINEAKWSISFNVSHDGRVNSFNLYAVNDDKFKTLQKYFEITYHCGVELSHGVTLRFDDGDIRIIFENLQTGLSFILQYVTNLDISPITKHVSTMQDNLKAIKLFEQQVNGDLVVEPDDENIIEKDNQRKAIAFIDSDGHTTVIDLSDDPDKAREILTDMVDDLVENHHLQSDAELVDAIKKLDYVTICDYINETEIHNSRDGFIVNIKTSWSKNYYF